MKWSVFISRMKGRHDWRYRVMEAVNLNWLGLGGEASSLHFPHLGALLLTSMFATYSHQRTDGYSMMEQGMSFLLSFPIGGFKRVETKRSKPYIVLYCPRNRSRHLLLVRSERCATRTSSMSPVERWRRHPRINGLILITYTTWNVSAGFFPPA